MPVAVLDASRVVLGARALNRREAILLVGRLLVRHGLAREGYEHSMLQREELMSTYVGNGVAIPHGLNADLVCETGLVFVQFPDGVDFGGETAYILVGIAARSDDHLEVLANLAEVLKDRSAVDRLRAATSAREVIDLLCKPNPGRESVESGSTAS